jgi:hypothetical protein
VFDFFADQNFLSAMAAIVGPLAFFAAPTEEIEYLVLHDTLEVEAAGLGVPRFSEPPEGLAEAA